MNVIFQYDKLCNTLGHTFEDEQLLHSALTHRSVSGQNNERMEFLGDSILNFIVGEALYQRYPREREGQLTRLRAELVKGETLAQIAREFNIGDNLILGPGEMKSGGHRRSSILADALEAIIAAIYLDAGMDKCREIVLSWFEDRLAPEFTATLLKDAKTRLQEYLQARKHPLPKYELLQVAGPPHQQVFEVTCTVEALSMSATAIGRSRRSGEQAAAEKMLSKITSGQ